MRFRNPQAHPFGLGRSFAGGVVFGAVMVAAGVALAVYGLGDSWWEVVLGIALVITGAVQLARAVTARGQGGQTRPRTQ